LFSFVYKYKSKLKRVKIISAMKTPTPVHGVSKYTEARTKERGKAVPLQAWSGPEGSRKLRLPEFMTMAQESGKVVNLTHRPPLTPGNTPGTHFC